jgi:hypothetical protein
MMNIIERIKAHEKEVLSGIIPDNLQICPKCKGSSRFFKLHEGRFRLFLVIVDCFVKQVEALLGRWKCPLCHKTSTYYPDFAIPYKRYVKDNILELSQKYLEEDNSTYETVVRKEDTAIVYDSAQSKKYECQVAGSTVWWWLHSIGSLKDIVSKAFSLIREKDPSSGIFRQIRPIKAKKYRSDERKKVLQQFARLLNAEEEFRRLFSHSIFPHFAILTT